MADVRHAPLARAVLSDDGSGQRDVDLGLAAIDPALVQRYQPYWTVVAEVAAACGDLPRAVVARERALALTTDPAVRRHLLARWGTEDVAG